MKQKLITPLLTFSALAAILAGCGKQADPQHQSPPKPQVTVAPAQQEEIVEWDEFTGRT